MLLMALVAMAGWVRARYISDVVRLDLGRRQHRLFTHEDRIHWVSYESQWKYWSLPIEWATSEPYDLLIFFTLTEYAPAKDCLAWEIPYWSLVIPLPLLSAWLLVSKPRPNKPYLHPERLQKVAE